MDFISQFATYFTKIYFEAAPYLFLGFVVAGLLHQFVPSQIITRFVSGNPVIACIKAAIVGTPVPLCSCGVVPVGLGLHRDGVGKHASVSFLIATPENGVDSISLSYSLFGGLFTVIRVGVALVVAVLSGIVIYLFDVRKEEESTAKEEEKSCCASKEPKNTGTKENGFTFILNDFLPKISNWILLGFVISAAITIFIPEGYMTNVDSRISLILAALVGLPLYVCASASTPIALGFLYAGMSPGACLVFLITGPATNAANIPLYIKELGARATYLFYGSLFCFSILCGWIVDLFITAEDLNTATFEHVHVAEGSTAGLIGTVLFSLMLFYVYIRKLRKFVTAKS